MRGWVWWGVFAWVGCEEPGGRSSRPDRDPGVAAPADGPGRWLAAPDPRGPSATVALEDEGVVATVDALASHDGGSVVFTEGSSLYATSLGDLATRALVEIPWSTSTEAAPPLALTGVGPSGDAVVVVEGLAVHVGGTLDGPRVVPLPAALVDARVAAGGVVGLTSGGGVLFEGGGGSQLDAVEVDRWSIAVNGDTVYVATPDEVLRVTRSGKERVAAGARHVAVDRQTGTLARAGLHRVEGEGWSLPIDGEVRGLASVGAAGVFAVWIDQHGDDLVTLLDARSGEDLGTLDVEDGMRALDGSGGGDLLLQVRGDDAVTWRVHR